MKLATLERIICSQAKTALPQVRLKTCCSPVMQHVTNGDYITKFVKA